MPDPKVEKYDEIFLPGSPLLNKDYFFGREQEKLDLRNALRRRGQHAIVIGPRGVGKTSLVKQILEDHEFKGIWRTCDPTSSFKTVFTDLLEDAGLDLGSIEETDEDTKEGEAKGTPFNIGLSGKMVHKHSEKHTPASGELTPWRVFKALESLAGC
ncbi:MAG: ATP-binding protein [Bacteroidota bacterium]